MGLLIMETTFKNGDVIAIRNPRGVEMIAIFDKFKPDGTLHIYIEFDTSEYELYFKCEFCDFCYDIDKIECRLATDEEKETLYHHLFLYFIEDWDQTWKSHFTDSSYFDILDCLLISFDIKVSEEDEWDYPDFLQDIRNYIWDECCSALQIKSNTPNTDISDKKVMVRLDDVCQWLMEQAGQYSAEVADAIEFDIIPKLRKSMMVEE